MNLAWNAVPGAQSYKIYYWNNAYLQGRPIIQNPDAGANGLSNTGTPLTFLAGPITTLSTTQTHARGTDGRLCLFLHAYSDIGATVRLTPFPLYLLKFCTRYDTPIASGPFLSLEPTRWYNDDLGVYTTLNTNADLYVTPAAEVVYIKNLNTTA